MQINPCALCYRPHRIRPHRDQNHHRIQRAVNPIFGQIGLSFLLQLALNLNGYVSRRRARNQNQNPPENLPLRRTSV
jgi:hypothetical protein